MAMNRGAERKEMRRARVRVVKVDNGMGEGGRSWAVEPDQAQESNGEQVRV